MPWRILLSAIWVLSSFFCFYCAPPTEKKTISTKTLRITTWPRPDYTQAFGATQPAKCSGTSVPAGKNQENVTLQGNDEQARTTEYERPGIAKFFEWLGLALLLLSGWLWRNELGITQLGPLGGGPRIDQEPPGLPPRSPEETSTPQPYSPNAIKAEMFAQEAMQRVAQIMALFQRSHAIGVAMVARQLGVSQNDAKALLFALTRDGILRADGFPSKTIYTPAQGLENRVLDAVRRKLSKTYEVIAERRYVRFNHIYEVDSLIGCAGINFVVEAKVVSSNEWLRNLEKWVSRLLKAAETFSGDAGQRVSCVLAIYCSQGIDVAAVKARANSVTFDSDKIPMQIMVFSETELSA